MKIKASNCTKLRDSQVAETGYIGRDDVADLWKQIMMMSKADIRPRLPVRAGQQGEMCLVGILADPHAHVARI